MSSVGVQRLLILVTLSACSLALEAQSNLRFLKDAPAGQFNQKDWSLLQSATRAALAEEADSAPKTWRNEENGHSGTVTTVKKYTSEGKDCRQLRFDSEASGRKGRQQFKVCLDADGVWREASSGAPFSDVISGPAQK
jgi:surface antigen